MGHFFAKLRIFFRTSLSNFVFDILISKIFVKCSSHYFKMEFISLKLRLHFSIFTMLVVFLFGNRPVIILIKRFLWFLTGCYSSALIYLSEKSNIECSPYINFYIFLLFQAFSKPLILWYFLSIILFNSSVKSNP